MDTSNTYTKEEYQAQKGLAVEFGSWPCQESQVEAINEIKWAFDDLLSKCGNRIPPHNGRYLALVKTKLEEACMFAVKGISLPEQKN